MVWFYTVKSPEYVGYALSEWRWWWRVWNSWN